jgi:hypothetical protein
MSLRVSATAASTHVARHPARFGLRHQIADRRQAGMLWFPLAALRHPYYAIHSEITINCFSLMNVTACQISTMHWLKSSNGLMTASGLRWLVSKICLSNATVIAWRKRWSKNLEFIFHPNICNDD